MSEASQEHEALSRSELISWFKKNAQNPNVGSCRVISMEPKREHISLKVKPETGRSLFIKYFPRAFCACTSTFTVVSAVQACRLLLQGEIGLACLHGGFAFIDGRLAVVALKDCRRALEDGKQLTDGYVSLLPALTGILYGITLPNNDCPHSFV